VHPDLSFNLIEAFPILPPCLEVCLLAHNWIAELRELSQPLTELDLSHNRVRAVRPLPPTLSRLYLLGNAISRIEPCALPRLTALTLERNRLAAVPGFGSPLLTSF
jgi:Leucine-rich repeat (LRR) protein